MHLNMKLVDHKGNAHNFVFPSYLLLIFCFLQKAIIVKLEIILKNIYPVQAFPEVSTYSIL